jgi:hypothetical protein
MSDQVLTMPVSWLAALRLFQSRDKTRVACHGVFFRHQKNGGLVAVATNGVSMLALDCAELPREGEWSGDPWGIDATRLKLRSKGDVRISRDGEGVTVAGSGVHPVELPRVASVWRPGAVIPLAGTERTDTLSMGAGYLQLFATAVQLLTPKDIRDNLRIVAMTSGVYEIRAVQLPFFYGILMPVRMDGPCNRPDFANQII